MPSRNSALQSTASCRNAETLRGAYPPGVSATHGSPQSLRTRPGRRLYDQMNLPTYRFDLLRYLCSNVVAGQKGRAFRFEELEEECVGVPHTGVRDRTIERAIQSKHLAQRQWDSPAHRWITVQVPDDEFAQKMHLLDRLAGSETPLGRDRTEQLKASNPEWAHLITVRTKHHRQNADQLVSEATQQLGVNSSLP